MSFRAVWRVCTRASAVGLVLAGCAEPEDTYVARDAGKDAKVDGGSDSVVTPDTPVDDTAPKDTGGCTPPAGKVCGVFPQCGCGAGEKCDITGADGTSKCSPDGTTAVNERCDKGESCTKGNACVGSLCRQYCNTDTDCVGVAKGACHAVTGGTPPVDIPGFKACFVECDPRNPAKDCGSVGGCSFLDSSTTTCVAAGTGTGVGACGASKPNNCAPGYVCLSTGDCKKWCRMTGSDCGGGACTKITVDGSNPTFGGIEYGICP